MQHREPASPVSQLSWDDLRFFLICAESGSFRKAGKLLKVELGHDCQKDYPT